MHTCVCMHICRRMNCIHTHRHLHLHLQLHTYVHIHIHRQVRVYFAYTHTFAYTHASGSSRRLSSRCQLVSACARIVPARPIRCGRLLAAIPALCLCRLETCSDLGCQICLFRTFAQPPCLASGVSEESEEEERRRSRSPPPPLPPGSQRLSDIACQEFEIEQNLAHDLVDLTDSITETVIVHDDADLPPTLLEATGTISPGDLPAIAPPVSGAAPAATAPTGRTTTSPPAPAAACPPCQPSAATTVAATDAPANAAATVARPGFQKSLHRGHSADLIDLASPTCQPAAVAQHYIGDDADAGATPAQAGQRPAATPTHRSRNAADLRLEDAIMADVDAIFAGSGHPAPTTPSRAAGRRSAPYEGGGPTSPAKGSRHDSHPYSLTAATSQMDASLPRQTNQTSASAPPAAPSAIADAWWARGMCGASNAGGHDSGTTTARSRHIPAPERDDFTHWRADQKTVDVDATTNHALASPGRRRHKEHRDGHPHTTRPARGTNDATGRGDDRAAQVHGAAARATTTTTSRRPQATDGHCGGACRGATAMTATSADSDDDDNDARTINIRRVRHGTRRPWTRHP